MLGLGKMLSCSLFIKFCTKVGPLCQKLSPPSNISTIPGLKPLINAPEIRPKYGKAENERHYRLLEVSL